jgi:ABC-type uncharacterized transport system auxiliary subunit
MLSQPLTAGALYVAQLGSGSLYRERALLYSDDAENLTVKQYHYHFWEEAPPRLLRQQLIQYLRASGAAPRVLYDSDTEADLTVQGRIKRFEHILGKDAVTARVALELRLLDRGGRVLVSGDYQAEQRAAARDVASVVSALDAALNEVFGRFLDDARQASTAPSRTQ